MRLLHTADWHLGLSNGPVSRAPDHDRFLDWLLVTLDEQEIDALLIAGDVFDSMQPSADAQARWYGFLARLRTTGVATVVVIGGNHDSAARLDAPRELLQYMDVHIVGGYDAEVGESGRCVVPMRDRSGAIGAVALAVPYVHEFRLGVRTTDSDRSAVRTAFSERFAELYRTLTDAAVAAHPGVPVVATGHLTVGAGISRDDYPQEIHQVGTIEALPPSIFDDRLAYIALGHIHSCRPVDESQRTWYSGTPVALTSIEGRTGRAVIRVDLPADGSAPATVTRLEVPASRALLTLKGTPDELLERIEALDWDEPLPPLLHLLAVTDLLPTDFQGRCQELLAARPEGERPVVVELRQLRATPLPETEALEVHALDELAPADVFARLLTREGITEPEPLERAFATLLAMPAEDVDGHCLSIVEGDA